MIKLDDAKMKKRMQESHSLLSNKHKEEIKKAFDYFDVTGSGRVKRYNRRS